MLQLLGLVTQELAELLVKIQELFGIGLDKYDFKIFW
jgi:hypothetical protein